MQDDKVYIESWVYRELKHFSKLTPENAQKRLIEFLKEVRPRQQRTSPQNRALHKKHLHLARAHLCEITDNPRVGIHPLSQERKEITDMVALIEKLMGVI